MTMVWDVAVIGAGLSGITCARQLAAKGLRVCILDKSRGLGGRIATRRVPLEITAKSTNPAGSISANQTDKITQIHADHGLKYWRPMSKALKGLTAVLVSAGVIKPWNVDLVEDTGADGNVDACEVGKSRHTREDDCHVAEAGMSAVAKYLLSMDLNFNRDTNILTGHKATKITPYKGHWRIHCEGGQYIDVKKCALAIPAPQVADLLDTTYECLNSIHSNDKHSDVNGNYSYTELGKSDRESFLAGLQHAKELLQSIRYHACITVIVGYDQQSSTNGWLADYTEDNAAAGSDTAGDVCTAWIGLDSSKRDTNPVDVQNASSGSKPVKVTDGANEIGSGREPDHEVTEDAVVVSHSTPRFAEKSLDLQLKDLEPHAMEMLAESSRKLRKPYLATPTWKQVHRWRYAQIDKPYDGQMLAITSTIVCGGDWCVDAVQGAVEWQPIDHAYASGVAMAKALE